MRRKVVEVKQQPSAAHATGGRGRTVLVSDHLRMFSTGTKAFASGRYDRAVSLFAQILCDRPDNKRVASLFSKSYARVVLQRFFKNPDLAIRRLGMYTLPEMNKAFAVMVAVKALIKARNFNTAEAMIDGFVKSSYADNSKKPLFGAAISVLTFAFEKISYSKGSQTADKLVQHGIIDSETANQFLATYEPENEGQDPYDRFKWLISHNYSSPALYTSMIEHFYLTGNYGMMRIMFDRAAGRKKADAETFHTVLSIYLAADMREEAARVLKVLKIYKGSKQIFAELVQMAVDESEHEQARFVYDVAHRLDRSSPELEEAMRSCCPGGQSPDGP